MAKQSMLAAGKPSLTSVQVAALSAERNTPLLNPTKRSLPLTNRDETKGLSIPALAPDQDAALSAERNMPLLVPANR